MRYVLSTFSVGSFSSSLVLYVSLSALSDLESCRLHYGDMSTMEMLSIVPLSREERLCEEAAVDVVVTLSINRRMVSCWSLYLRSL